MQYLRLMIDSSNIQFDPSAAGRRRTADAPGRLPHPPTSFVGREQELGEARRLLARNRLLTLTGPGGCGKTRLAIELGASVAAEYPDGVHFIPLAGITDPALVSTSIAQGLGLQDSRGRPLLEHLTSYLQERKLLLVLDNFEHLLPAGRFVAELRAASTHLQLLVTSRSPLHLSGEQEFPVPPLVMPQVESVTSPPAVVASDSAQLFAVRAAASVPAFAISDQNADAIVRIVHRLDGMPLAIELAAARVKMLTPEAILARLDHSLGLLVAGGWDVPDRQRTLRATIAWSYNLLSEGARRLLAACSVFRGGVNLDIIETVCAEAVDLGVPILDALAELVDQSLLSQGSAPTTVPRYTMLETVREFAAEQLAEMDEAADAHEAHASAFRSVATDLDRPPCWPAKAGLDLIELEHDNFRAALDWAQTDHPAAALRLANRLTAFWSARGHFSEGRRRLGNLIELVPNEDSERLAGLSGLAWLATDQGDYAVAIDLLGQSIAASRARHDVIGEGYALFYRARATMASGRVVEGGKDAADALELLTQVGDAAGVASALFFCALATQYSGDLELACDLFARCAAMYEESGLLSGSARALQLLGIARLILGDLPAARAALEQGLPVIVDIGDRFAIPSGLSGMAGVAAKSGRPRLALRLAGAAATYEEVNQTHLPDPLRALLDEWLAPARALVGGAAARLFAEGRSMTLDDAVAHALADEPEDPWRVGPGTSLTRRESEVAALVAHGLTNRDIAGQLYISVRTVEVHVDRILSKLGFRTRTQLAAWAHDEGLAPRNT
jgi:predicted ATPase/DNA-binding CsgD family transcriptional regulator